jgi:ankyrin repeat protein
LLDVARSHPLHNAGINLQSISGKSPLLRVLTGHGLERKVVDIVQRLLEHGANPNIHEDNQTTALHHALSHGSLKAAQLLLSYGAMVDEKDKKGKTPFQVAASKGHDKLMKLLLEHGAVPSS